MDLYTILMEKITIKMFLISNYDIGISFCCVDSLLVEYIVANPDRE